MNKIYQDLGFIDPYGGNEKEIEASLHEASSSIAKYLSGVAKKPVFTNAVPSFAETIPQKPMPLPQLLEEVFAKIVSTSMHLSHPLYMSHMDSGVAFAGILGDFIASSLNQNLLSEELSPAATVVEQQVIRWFCELAQLPVSSGGTFVGGGTGANLTALLGARDRVAPNASRQGLFGQRPLRIFGSVESHYSLRKAAAVLGIGSDSMIPIATDSSYRMSIEDLLQKIRQEKAAGNLPMAIVATAGTTSTGSIDPITKIAEIAAKEKIWLHVDASHGGALLFSKTHREKLAGIERADSIAFDPHKWLWAPKSAGICVFRDFKAFIPANYNAPYIHREEKKNDLGRKTIDGSRHFDALKVWMMIRHLGVERIGQLVDKNITVTQALREKLQQTQLWEPIHQPQINVLCFASKDPGILEQETHERVLRSGKAWISITSVQGKRALRTVILNPSTEIEDLSKVLEILEARPKQRTLPKGVKRF